MSSTPTPPTQNEIDFRDRNAVERLLETKRFRRCTNLECQSVSHPNMQMLYMPVCLEGRFAKEGVAQHIELPLPTRPLSPVTYTTIPIWAPLISCPPDCKGYRNRTIAKLRALFKRKPHDGVSAKKEPWSRGEKIAAWTLLVAVVAIGGSFFVPEVRQFFHLEKRPHAAPATVTPSGPTADTLPAVTQPQQLQNKQPAKSKGAGGVGSNGNTVGKSLTIQQSNSGGINVQQATTGNNSPIINSPITIGVVPKRISALDMASISQFLSGAKSKAHLKIAIDQNNNARGFADDFYKAAKDGQWPMEDAGVDEFIGFSPPGKKFQGVVIVIKGEPLKPNETVYLTESDPLFYIAQVIDALKLPHILRREPSQPDGRILVQFEGGLPD